MTTIQDNKLNSLPKPGRQRAKGMPAAKKREIIERLKLEQPGTKIAKELGLTLNAVYTVKRRAKQEIETALTIKNNIDINKFESDITNNLKRNLLNINNHILSYNYNKASLNQLIYAFGILFDKLRLIEGKSTTNIATQIMTHLNPEQLAIIQDSIRSLKESMLKGNNETSPNGIG